MALPMLHSRATLLFACSLVSPLLVSGGPVSEAAQRLMAQAYGPNSEPKVGPAVADRQPEVRPHAPLGIQATSRATQSEAACLDQARLQINLLEIFDNTSVLESARALSPAERLARFDRDLDGRLLGAEANQAQAEQEQRAKRLEALTGRYDDNRNGRLDAAEMSRARAEANDARRRTILARYDHNRNGVLDPEERRLVGLHRSVAEQLQPLVFEFDRNGNRALDPGEKQALTQFLAKELQKQLPNADALGPEQPARWRGFTETPALAPARPSHTDQNPAEPFGPAMGAGSAGDFQKSQGDLRQGPASIGPRPSLSLPISGAHPKQGLSAQTDEQNKASAQADESNRRVVP